MKNAAIDNGRTFDWGRTSADYARYRDIYPPAFYRRLLDAGLCAAGMRVLDIGTGTGVIPRNLYGAGASFTGLDISENQIRYARALAQSQHMDIDFRCMPAEKADFADGSFDTVTACQCFAYFDHDVLAPQLHRILSPGGRFAVLYMAWLPFEDPIAAASEALVLRYNPAWTGCGATRCANAIPAAYDSYFETESETVFDLQVPFTRESWNGRIKACRGIGASLSEAEIADFERAHKKLLAEIAPDAFSILHYAAITILKRR